MKVNWTVLGVFLFFVILLVVYLIKRNLKDKKELSEFLNNDFNNNEESELNNEK